jgi:transcriptional regulator with PAS, ATPase and Fis domain
MEHADVKQRFGIIGNSPLLNRAIEVARQVAPTDMSVLITGESGVGKEVFSHIIHNLSSRKHGPFIAVNCGAIPEGTIDSELFGHEKGSFTGAVDSRKGYFEEVNSGTIFLDEVAELPLGTQARLLRVLETGEFIRVGSSKVQKTNVRVIAATNVNMMDLIGMGKFREDLFYRLNTVPIKIPALRERKEDIYLLFRKFTADFSDKYKTPGLTLAKDAQETLMNYRWPGNIRQLKNIAEQISVLESDKEIEGATLSKYLPNESSQLPMLLGNNGNANSSDFSSERDILYKVLFDMKKDITDLKKIVFDIIQNAGNYNEDALDAYNVQDLPLSKSPVYQSDVSISKASENYNNTIEIEETLSLEDREIDLIKKALKKHKGRRKNAAKELGISERTLYRKIKEHDLNL